MKRTSSPLGIALLALLAVVVSGCAMMAASGPQAAQSITNNQEAGVDEGGIVKAWRDYLIVLRRGRIFTVRLGKDALEPLCKVDAFPPGQSYGTWYDEMLVHGKAVVVVGYSYRVRATEIGLFRLDDAGCVSHRATYFLRSNDYYSARNYASRLVRGKLVFYLPHVLGSYRVRGGQLVVRRPLPSVQRHTRRGRTSWQPVIAASSLPVPSKHLSVPTLHTVVTCDLERPTLECTAQGMIGSFGRSFYVSGNAVYVWVSEGSRARQRALPPSVVYRLPLDGSPGSSLRAWGMPVDQFSFKESARHLNVLVRASGGGDWMWGSQRTGGAVALARIPLSAFSGTGGILSGTAYRYLPAPRSRYAFRNRFVGDHLLYGTGAGWWYGARRASTLYVVDVTRRGEVSRIPLPHGIDRLETLGSDAVVIGSDGKALHFTSLALGARPRVRHSFKRPGATQGEQRSHGFFFRPDGPRRGVLALPIRKRGRGWYHLYRGSAGILYLDVRDLRLTPLGSLNAKTDRTDDHCRVSCVDWYGNARPVFYNKRVYALLGYELVEGVIRGGEIKEAGRTHLYRDLPQVVAR